MHTCCAIADPNEMPSSATGGSHAPRISSAVSRAKLSTGQASGDRTSFARWPRLSNVVLRNDGSKCGIW
ncbi:MAG: hypothetical protein ACXWZF_01920 [Actinomycetota bacterium]